MANGQRSTVLRHLHQLLGARNFDELSDGQLLQRFAQAREEAAFAALVRRHGPLVLGVCRRVLHDSHAAEDAFQATFLVLFRRARSLDRHGSVANWLYTVAYHVALRARQSAARRQVRERQVVEMPQPEAHAAEIWQDLQPVLDEELNRLPDKYREPVLLCYLEGKTNEEAARLLGCPIGTVKGRLARARQLLRARLARRGVTLATGMLGTVLAAHAPAAVPARLVEATVKTTLLFAAGNTAAGLGSASVAGLAEGVLKAMFVSQLKIATAVLLALGVAALGAGTLTHRALAQRQDQTGPAAQPQAARVLEQPKASPRPPVAEPGENQPLTITGRVLDAAGRPVAEAPVTVLGQARRPSRPTRVEPWPQALGQGKTDREGHFRLSVPRPPKAQAAISVVASAAGHALVWHNFMVDALPTHIEIHLPAEQLLRGRLVDLQGQPAAGVTAHVYPTGIRQPGPPTFSALGSPEPSSGLTGWPGPVTTDAQGRFTLGGLAPGWNVTLRIQDDRFGRQELYINLQEREKSDEVSLALAPARVLTGTVTYADTGQPVPQARLLVVSEPARYHYSMRWFESQADAQGRFRVNPYPGNSLKVVAYPPASVPYLSVSKALTWPQPAVVQQEIHLALPRGIRLHGTVTESPSGKPVAGASVEFCPREGNNPFFREDVTEETEPAVSGPDGSFQTTILPGPGHLLVKGSTPDYLHAQITSRQLYGIPIRPNRRHYPDALVSLDLKPDVGSHELNVTLRRGVTVKGRVVGPDGKPVAEGLFLSRSYVPDDDHTLHHVEPLPVRDGRFELPGCDPNQVWPVFFLDSKKQLGVLVELSGKQAGDEALTIHLQPCGSATARFLDDKGQPLANMQPRVEMSLSPGISFFEATLESEELASDDAILSNLEKRYRELRTDVQGRITFPTLIPGAPYRIVARPPEERYVVVRRDLTVKSGQTLDLGDVTVQTGK
jgi:RNA polymerase sigma factor (sigma-70 family)